MPSISIIIPVYQAEQYLPGCVESVVRQTFSDWEMLLIDDGCTDGSGALCDQYAAGDSRIRAFHKENGGVSSARNLGLEKALGEAIAFLDADDRYEPRFLETLWALRQSAGADTAACAHWNLWPDGREEAEQVLPPGIYEREAIRQKVVAPLLGERLRQPVFNGFIWRYLYTAQIIRRFSIAFEGAYLEDELFLLEYFCHAERLAVTGQPLYRYLLNPASATHRYMRHFPETFRRYMDRKEKIAARCGLEDLCPGWRENSNWAGLLIGVGNAFAPGGDLTLRQRRQAVEALCQQPEMAAAISALTPEGLGRNKQLVARLIKGRHFWLLTQLYRLKNRI